MKEIIEKTLDEVFEETITHVIDQDDSDRVFAQILLEGCPGLENEDPLLVIEDYFYTFCLDDQILQVRQSGLLYQVSKAENGDMIKSVVNLEEPFTS